MEFLSKHKVKIAIGVFVLFIFAMLSANVSRYRQEKAEAELEAQNADTDSGMVSTTDAEGNVIEVTPTPEIEYNDNEIEYLMTKQEDLCRRYGDLPDGFIWNLDGKLLSIGDPSKTAEESLYAYLNAVSSLDISTIQRYSRNSYVVNRYSRFFDSSDYEPTYSNQFLRNMYRECMLSLQIDQVLSSSVFAQNRIVFSVQAEVLDLTSKDFWLDDKSKIYEDLHIYSLESDSTKANMYLYDYILNYYRSDKAKLRTVVFDITMERYSDVNSGWLVSIDSDVDDACVYRDGKLVVNYITDKYNNEAVPMYEKMEEEARELDYDDSDYGDEDWENDDTEYDFNSEGQRIDEDGNVIDEEDSEDNYGDTPYDTSDDDDEPNWDSLG